MNEIVKRTQDMLAIVSNYRAEDMTIVFAKLSALKSALESADMFFEASVQFARLEAYALIRAVELSDGKKPKLTGKNKEARSMAGVWLYNMTERERNEIIEKCNEGKTIVAIYRAMTAPDQKEIASRIKKKVVRELLDDLELDGSCQLNKYERYLKRIDPELKNDVKEGIRGTLLLKGAVGIKDQQGTYIVPERNEPKILYALTTRLHSICFDFSAFVNLAKKCVSKPGFRINNNNINKIEDFLLLFAFCEGAISLSMTPKACERLRKVLNELLKRLDDEEGRERFDYIQPSVPINNQNYFGGDRNGV
jgi:hypothetical protein